ncbi:MAG: NAD-dependent epimerase/dehydratase family protein [Candidatus Poseidoniaceae archaeon]|jgi:nucleoside-diphosphate-sugar epimerase|nr:NAD-dependent epimerase/dehydratase family protein [Candidatus Poseidoniaceae archaeon]
MVSVLVTGGSGFIGTHLCSYLHQNGYDVISLDNNHTGAKPWECVLADIRDQLQFDGIDVIIHLAAQISVAASVEDPDHTLSVNIDGTKSVISAAELSGVKRILFASSAAIYGDSEEIPIKESNPLIPQSPYAVSKIVGEELCLQSNLQSCSMRFFNVYGPGQSAEGGYAAVIPAFKKAIDEKVAPRVFGDGTQIRDFVHVLDLVKIIEQLVRIEDLPECVNVASGEATSLLDLLEGLSHLNPKMETPLFEGERSGDIHTSIADITMLKKYIPQFVPIPIQEGLK